MANLAMDATDDHIRDFCEKMGPVSSGACLDPSSMSHVQQQIP
jgi:hypothetical protein